MQIWSTMAITGQEKTSHLLYWLELQERVGHNAKNLSQSLVRPGLGYAFNQNNSIWLGYAYIYTDFPFANFKSFGENRIWQQWLWTNTLKQFNLTNRLRLEERTFSNVSGTSWRIRDLFKINTPIGITNTDVIISDEVFVHLNPVFYEQGAPPFDQNRLFIGLGYQASKNIRIEAGYLYQYIERIGPSDFVGNVASLTFLYQNN